jgi:predicted ATP-binding protein involved in virulence
LLSTGNVFTEIDFSNGKTTLIHGENGAGKCVRRNTTAEVAFQDAETERKFKEFIKKRTKSLSKPV